MGKTESPGMYWFRRLKTEHERFTEAEKGQLVEVFLSQLIGLDEEEVESYMDPDIGKKIFRSLDGHKDRVDRGIGKLVEYRLTDDFSSDQDYSSRRLKFIAGVNEVIKGKYEEGELESMMEMFGVSGDEMVMVQTLLGENHYMYLRLMVA